MIKSINNEKLFLDFVQNTFLIKIILIARMSSILIIFHIKL